MAELPLNYSGSLDTARSHAGEVNFLWKTHRWMSAGLALTGAVAWLVAINPFLAQAVSENPFVFYGALLVELALVFTFAARAARMSHATALAVFAGYAAVNGVTMAMIFIIYTATSIALTFFVCAGAFGSLSVYGAVTKRDLTAMGQFMFVGLIGLLIASVANLFLRSSALGWVTTCAGVLIFAGLTAYDNQKLRRLYALQGETGNLAIQGALTLYLDFVNLFLQLLRLFGRRR